MEKNRKLLKSKQIHSPFNEPWSVKNALAKGGWKTKLSMLFMGFGNIMHGQVIKGLLFLATQILFVYFLIRRILPDLSQLHTLGTQEMVEVWNPDKMTYEYEIGDNSALILLWGVIAIVVILAFIMLWRASLKSSYKSEYLASHGEKLNGFKDDLNSLVNERIHLLLLSLPIAGIVIFTILPLLYMISMAFTSYSKIGEKLVLFDWVGLDNFSTVLNPEGNIGSVFWPILGWTLIWAILATGLNFILGLGLTMLINRKETRFKSFWRVMFSLTIAVPQFISLLAVRTMLGEYGAINLLLQDLKIAENALPFLTNPQWARVTVIVVNLWVGIPYTLLQVTGILQNFPVEFEEAARIDGANAWHIFAKIKLPYILFITTPYLITQFTGNINNFNVIYLLSGGGPPRPNSTAGFTDLLVTWLYKLTIDNQYYNIGAVIGIFTFVTLSIVALVTYTTSGSYKDEEAFQ